MKLMQFLMGLDDCYEPVRSSLLTRELLHKVKDAYIVVAREESYRGVYESSGVTQSKLNANSFTAKSFNSNNSNNNNRRGYNNSNNNTRGNLPCNRGLTVSFYRQSIKSEEYDIPGSFIPNEARLENRYSRKDGN
ncbi:hypothetical protein Tco_1230759 [Tanacetum coccineum]